MKWNKVTLNTTTQALDYFGVIADELGLEGFLIEDNVPLSQEDKEKMFIDILPELPPDEGKAKVSFFVEEDIDLKKLYNDLLEQAKIYEDFCDFGEMTLELSETEDKDWINNWKEFFKPFRVDDRIVIKPTWESMPKDVKADDIVIEIDPGTAFGTGAHETTKLCIFNLRKYLKKDDLLLDVGCGSGILSIAGLKLNARSAFGIDIDENASKIAVENTQINNIETGYLERLDENQPVEVPDGSVLYTTGNVIDDGALRKGIGLHKYDVVVANILADIIIPLSKVVGEFMKDGAYFISSGIINTKEQAVKDALTAAGFRIVDVTYLNDWVSIIAQK